LSLSGKLCRSVNDQRLYLSAAAIGRFKKCSSEPDLPQLSRVTGLN
jgi:hypothetical protein